MRHDYRAIRITGHYGIDWRDQNFMSIQLPALVFNVAFVLPASLRNSTGGRSFGGFWGCGG